MCCSSWHYRWKTTEEAGRTTNKKTAQNVAHTARTVAAGEYPAVAVFVVETHSIQNKTRNDSDKYSDNYSDKHINN